MKKRMIDGYGCDRWQCICSGGCAKASSAGLSTNATVGFDQMGGITMIPLVILSFQWLRLYSNYVTLREKRLLHTEMMPELLEMMLQKKLQKH